MSVGTGSDRPATARSTRRSSNAGNPTTAELPSGSPGARYTLGEFARAAGIRPAVAGRYAHRFRPYHYDNYRFDETDVLVARVWTLLSRSRQRRRVGAMQRAAESAIREHPAPCLVLWRQDGEWRAVVNTDPERALRHFRLGAYGVSFSLLDVSDPWYTRP